MPRTKDKFTTVLDRGDSATVIRKGSKAADIFNKGRAESMKTYKDLDEKFKGTPSDLAGKYPATNNRINREAASNRGAAKLGETVKRDYGK